MKAAAGRLRAAARATLAVCVLACAGSAARALPVVDDRGSTIDLAGPARRIVSLAPHITELLFAAGAGDRIVATVAYSNFPEAARKLPRIGDAHALDLERLVGLKPDLVVAWAFGSAQPQIEVLKALGIAVYQDAPQDLDHIARSIERFGQLAGTGAVAGPAAARLRSRLADLRRRHAGRSEVSVFHQVWDRPLMTVGGRHLISQVLGLCGGRNVFAGLAAPAPHVAFEAVLEADPEVVVSAGEGTPLAAGLGAWLAWPQLRAVARGNLVVVEPDLISQPVPRLLDGAEQVCAALEAARKRRPPT